MALPALDDPFYYLANFHSVLNWLTSRYADLLSAEERDFITTFETLPRASQALLVRMVMRKGVDFRASRLVYAEIGEAETAAAALIDAGFIEVDAPLTLEALFALTTKPELAAGLDGLFAVLGVTVPSVGKRHGKSEWLAALQAQAKVEAHIEAPAPRALQDWLPMLEDRHYRLNVDTLCERLRLMFFGNLRQQWSEFVLADLGVFRFENVALDASSRAFSQREDLETYHHLHRCRERFDSGESLETLLPDVPRAAFENVWLERRRGRLLYRLAYHLERQGALDQALAVYRQSSAPESRVREIRVLEALERVPEALALADAAAKAPVNASESQFLARILPRLRRKRGLPKTPTSKSAEPARFNLELPRSAWVEGAVVEHLSTSETPVFYVENTLITALFGLLCWEAIFAPLPGAFFHPFHRGPVDLHDSDFSIKRRQRFETSLASLERGDYVDVIRRRYHQKYGIQSPFVFWEGLDEHVLELALACIPASHLRLWFERLLGDIRANRAGMPDLIQFWPASDTSQTPRYRMIEVKGPGDRLQDNQKRWLAFCAEHAMPVSVCYVAWQPDGASAVDGGALI